MNKVEMNLRNMAVGINSTVDITKDMHIIFLDFDRDDVALIRDSVRELQSFWYLSDAYIFKTKNGFHAIFFHDFVPYSRLRMIVDYARWVDPLFQYISRYHHHKTLRVAGKHKERDISFVEILKGVRTPTAYELEIGELKRFEHMQMTGLNY